MRLSAVSTLLMHLLHRAAGEYPEGLMQVDGCSGNRAIVGYETVFPQQFAQAWLQATGYHLANGRGAGSVDVFGQDKLESPVTQWLQRWQAGEAGAQANVVEQVYATLHDMAQAKMAARGQSAALLQPTALVNEALMRLLASGADYRDRVHFFATASLKMRAVLVDYARSALADKRGGGVQHLTLSAADQVSAGLGQDEFVQLLALHQALERFSALDGRAARAVELSYFGGMNQEEIALVLAVSVATVERDLRIARAWLRRTLESASVAEKA